MDAGVSLATIQRWLGHHNISQTSTYLSAALGNDAAAMAAFEQKMGRFPYVGMEHQAPALTLNAIAGDRDGDDSQRRLH